MNYRGHVKNGVVVFDDPASLPDGTVVRVETVELPDEGGVPDENGQSLSQKLLKYAGKARDLPPDLARNHDHYIHGTPRE